MRVGRINEPAVVALAQAVQVVQQEDAVAVQILQDAQDLAPVLTGTLRRSLVVVKVVNPNGDIEYRVGWDPTIADYGPIVEFGSEDTPAQPHLRPAAIRVRGR